MSVPCTVCGDTEPSHVHDQGRRIEDYFTVGRGESEMDAARRWKERALKAERRLGQSTPRYPKWRIEAYRRAQERESQARREAYAIKRAAERQAGER